MLDRVDEQLEVALPSEEMREQLLQLYFHRYLTNSDDASSSIGMMERMRRMFSGKGLADKIDVTPVDSVRRYPVRVTATHCVQCGAHGW